MISIRAVLSTIESGVSDRKILRIVYDETKKKSRAGELSYLKAMSYKYNFSLEAVAPEEIERIALGNSHGGIICETTARTLPSLDSETLVHDFPDENARFFAMLEGIEDPYNFGYAVRSLWAAGISALILPPRNWMAASGVVCRASAGASELCPMYVAESSADVVSTMRSLGVKLICCDIKNSISIYDADLKKPLLLAVGGEKRGLSHELLSAADAIVRLDYGRSFTAALSAASASSIAAYEVFRQNR
ncbi:MAG: RNA methyltransferase [Clostridiales bacterium]|nr:RNA methyltransferase [Clostridiales bacterium]